MATTISTQDIVDAKRDIDDIGKAVNEKVIVSPRYGEDFKSLPMIAAEFQISSYAAEAAAVSAAESANIAQSSANIAEAAATAAIIGAGVFETPEAGVDPVTGVADGAYFNVRSSSDESYIDEYQNIGGVPTPTGKTYPSAAALADVKDSIIDPITGKASADKVFLSNGINLGLFLDQWVDITNLLIVSDPLASTWNSTVINNAIAKAKAENKGITCAPKGTIHAEGDLDFKFIRYIEFYSDILNSTGTVIVGGFSSSADPVKIRFQRVTNGTSSVVGAIPTIDTFRIEGIKAGVVDVGQVNLIRIHAVGGSSNSDSNAYFTINLGGSVRAFRVSDSGSGGWNNRISVIGGRIIDLDITGTGYTHNELLFDSNTFEGSLVSIRMKRAWTNRIINARFENVSAAPGIVFESDTMQNTIIQKWSGSGSPRGQFNFSPKVVDSGQNNQCVTQSAIEYDAIDLFNVSANSEIVANANSSACPDARVGRTKGGLVNVNVLQPSLTGFTAIANRSIAMSDVIEVQRGDVIKFDCDYDGEILRPLIYVFDKNMRVITTDNDHILIAASSFNAQNGSYSTPADRNAVILQNGASVNTDEVGYIQVGCYSTVGGFFRHVSATLYTQKLLRNKTKSLSKSRQVIPDIAGAPTSGFASYGAKIYDTITRSTLTCVNMLDTYVTTASTSNVVVVSRATNLKSGNIVGVMQTDGSTKWTSITAVSGTSITLADTVDVSEGCRFVANEWSYNNPSASVTYDPPSISAGVIETTTVALSGATVGSFVQAAFSQYHADIEISAAVSTANNVTVKFKNTGATAVDLPSGTLTVKMI